MSRAPLAVLALALLAFTSCSATIPVRGTAPASDNAGTCTLPALTANPAGIVTVHVQLAGPVAREDSLRVAAGSPFTFNFTGMPFGTYTVRAWASDQGGGGCDTTVTYVAKAPPWKVQL